VRVALDTNVMAYAEGVGDGPRCRHAAAWIARLPGAAVLVPAQTLGELARVLHIKERLSAGRIRSTVVSWADSFAVADSTASAFRSALDLTVDHGVPMWDALILAVAAEHRCRFLLSEDFQAGFTWGGVTVVNPFESQVPPLLKPWAPQPMPT
jgi:predicted nucleic acid-binding protein